ncbi:MAG: hypothetical protein RBU30_22685, partial [Polyangia bacterium]|nr:hypothetical protein [Polyangia bacterium]
RVSPRAELARGLGMSERSRPSTIRIHEIVPAGSAQLGALAGLGRRVLGWPGAKYKLTGSLTGPSQCPRSGIFLGVGSVPGERPAEG